MLVMTLAATWALTAAAPMAVPKAALAAGVTADDWQQLDRGEVVSHVVGLGGKQPVSRGSGAFVVELPWRVAFEKIGKVEDQPEYSSCLKALQLLMRASRDGQTTIKTRETHQSLWVRAQYTLDYVEDEEHKEIRWSLDPTAHNDVAQMTGAWRFVELGESRTLITYQIAATSGRALPAVIEDYFTGVMLPTFLKSVREYVVGSAHGDPHRAGGAAP